MSKSQAGLADIAHEKSGKLSATVPGTWSLEARVDVTASQEQQPRAYAHMETSRLSMSRTLYVRVRRDKFVGRELSDSEVKEKLAG